MSYADYRTGGGRRPAPPARDPGAFDSFAAAGATSAAPPPRRTTPPRQTSPPTSSPAPVVQPPTTNASMFGTARVDNPYATSAYASSRGGGGGGGSGSGASAGPLVGDMGLGGGGPEFYVSSRTRGNRQGKLKDNIKNAMAAAKQDNWKVVCVKATNYDIAAPKGKHVRVIMQGLQWGGSITNRESPAGGIFYHLRKRMMQNEWVVAVKAQTIFHHIFRDGNEKFVEYIAANARSVFRMEFFADSSSEGFAHAGFIKSYGHYIEQWLAMKAAIQFPVGKSREDDPTSTARYRESAIEELLAALPVLMDTLNALFAIELAGQIKFSAVANPAFSMILRDLNLIWVALSEGMIRLLDLYFTLEIPLATIALDVYKRFVDLVGEAQPFFDIARSLNVRWQPPQLGSISLELLESMRQYLTIGPEDPNAKQEEPTFSDEEVYEPEPPAPEPDHYYEPEAEYYSEEEPEIEPPRLPTPSVSSSESESEPESESESESSESEEEPVKPLTPPPPPPAPKKFDPLADLLGITGGVGPTANGHGVAPTPANQVTIYTGGTPGLMQRAALEHTVDDRVANVKGMMAAAPPMRNGQQQTAQRSGFGVGGTNMQLALYGQQAQQTPQQQIYAAAVQQQQQQMAAYQTMAAYQSMAMYQSMAGMAPNAMQQQQQQFAAAAMAAQQQQQRGVMPGAAYMPVPQGNSAVPAMRAEAPVQPAGAYRVQRSVEKKRVSDSDTAFGPLLDQMKNTSLGK